MDLNPQMTDNTNDTVSSESDSEASEETMTNLKDSSPMNLIPASADVIEEEVLESTPIEELAKIINKHAENFAANAISIGICLKLARNRLPKGKQHKVWENWIKENVKFSVQTAYKFVKCAEYFKELAPARIFMTAQMFEMLSLKQEDLKEFLNDTDKEGTPLENLTKMEIRTAVKEWKEKHGYEKNDSSYQYLISTKVKKPEDFQTIGIHVKKQDICKFTGLLEAMIQGENGLTEDSKKSMSEVIKYLNDKYKE